MKKLLLAIGVIASMSMISCSCTNTENAEQAEVTEDTIAVVEEPVDTTAIVCDSSAAPADELPPPDSITGD